MSIAQASRRRRSESPENSESGSDRDDLADWMATNPKFSINIPANWKLSTSSTDSRPDPQRISGSASRLSSSAASETSRSTSISWDMARPPSSFTTDSVVSPIMTDYTTPSANGDVDVEVTPQLSNATPQLRQLPNGFQVKMPMRDPAFSRKSSDLSTFAPIPSIPGSTPRRPPLPPTTPNDELPPPSPRPSHARPSPLPKAGFPSQRIEASSAAAVATPSPLQQVASTPAHTLSPLEVTYRAPEDLAPTASSSSYFPPPAEFDAGHGSSDAAGSDDDDMWEDESNGDDANEIMQQVLREKLATFNRPPPPKDGAFPYFYETNISVSSTSMIVGR